MAEGETVSVYVDGLADRGMRLTWGFRLPSAHLTADSIDELHEFAAKLGLKRKWFQDHPWHPHYDIGGRFYQEAINLGAIVPKEKT